MINKKVGGSEALGKVCKRPHVWGLESWEDAHLLPARSGPASEGVGSSAAALKPN